MAYVVGSASVEVVPDFRNAQVSITRWFARQKDEIKVPVKPDVDETAARAAGSRMGRAMADGQREVQRKAVVDRETMYRGMFDRIERQEQKAARDAERVQRESTRSREAMYRQMFDEIERQERQSARESSRIQREVNRDQERAFRESRQRLERDHAEAIRIRAKIELDERQSMMEGRRHGGIIARAIQRELKENAGIIMSGLAAALIAGAPLALLAASAMFAGIAAAGVSQNERLRQSWQGLWDEIKSGAQADAAVLVPTFDRMAGQIGQSFQRLRPMMREAFEAVGPQIDSFTASLLQAGENAFPALVRAVQAGTPVIQGAGLMLERFGTGLGEFFDRLTANAPAAGLALADLGDTFGVLLPLLGELLAQGATLATMVLPALTGAFSGVLTVVDSLGGALPIMLAGFFAFRAVQGTGRMLTNWATTLGMVSIQGRRFSGVAGDAAGALSRVGRVLPFVGIGVAAVAMTMASSSKQMDKWTQALIAGGKAARQATDEMADPSVWQQLSFVVSNFFSDKVWGNLSNSPAVAMLEEAKEKADEYLASLTPLERAQRDLSIAEKVLAEAMGNQGVSASELARLQADVARESARASRELEALEQATRGVTEAMVEQADAARARVDADFGYQKALLDVENSLIDVKDAQIALDEARAEGNPEAIIAAELGLREALLGVNEAYADQLSAANELATSNLPAAMDDNQKAILGYKAELDELNKLIEQGVVLPPSMEAYRQKLIEITGEADGALLAQAQLAAAIGELGFAVEALPGTKAVQITAPTDEVKQRLLDLNFTVTTMEDGSIRVEAITDEAKGNLGELSSLLIGLDGTTAKPGVALVDEGFIGPVQGVRNNLGEIERTTAKPGVALVDKGFIGPVQGVRINLDSLGRIISTPTIRVLDQASGPLVNIASAINRLPSDKQIRVNTLYTVSGSSVRSTVGPAEGGAIENGLIAPYKKYDIGGAIIGVGGPRADLIPAYGPEGQPNYRVSNGEHILDGRDVALMGGQAGVYAFREALNAGKLGGPSADVSISQMVATGQTARMPAMPAGNREVTILTQDNPRAIVRAIRADDQQQAALAPVW